MATNPNPKELKPCPLCGGAMEISVQLFRHAENDSQCLLRDLGWPVERIQDWNKRAGLVKSSAPQQTDVERLLLDLRDLGTEGERDAPNLREFREEAHRIFLQARAAIAAMQQPVCADVERATPEMVAAAVEAMDEAENTPFLNPPNAYLAEVAINAALLVSDGSGVEQVVRAGLADDLCHIAAHEADPRKEAILYEAAETIAALDTPTVDEGEGR